MGPVFTSFKFIFPVFVFISDRSPEGGKHKLVFQKKSNELAELSPQQIVDMAISIQFTQFLGELAKNFALIMIFPAIIDGIACIECNPGSY